VSQQESQESELNDKRLKEEKHEDVEVREKSLPDGKMVPSLFFLFEHVKEFRQDSLFSMKDKERLA
jgi:hypothetical protein